MLAGAMEATREVAAERALEITNSSGTIVPTPRGTIARAP
jgi:hypothetical protein